MEPALAARSSALRASFRASTASPAWPPVATLTAFETRVLAALRRGWLTSARRSAVRTRLSADGVRAPVQPRGFLAKSKPLQCDVGPPGAHESRPATGGRMLPERVPCGQ